jgi:hypothetical protein
MISARWWCSCGGALSKSRQWVLTVLRSCGDLQTVNQLGARLAQTGHPLKPRTVQTALGELERPGARKATAEPLLVTHHPNQAYDDPAKVGRGHAMTRPASGSIGRSLVAVPWGGVGCWQRGASAAPWNGTTPATLTWGVTYPTRTSSAVSGHVQTRSRRPAARGGPLTGRAWRTPRTSLAGDGPGRASRIGLAACCGSRTRVLVGIASSVAAGRGARACRVACGGCSTPLGGVGHGGAQQGAG